MMEVVHDIRLVGLQALFIERAVLLVEVVEAGVPVERVELVDEVVDVNIAPTLFEVGPFTKELDSTPVDVEVDGHVHRGIVADAILVAETLEAGYGGVLPVGREPRLGVLGVLSCHVLVVLAVARRAGEDAHQLDGLADFNLDLTFSSLLGRLCRRGECGGGKDD